LKLSGFADRKHKRLEKTVLTKADRVVTISKSCGADLEVLGGRTVDVITNGYDEDDFKFNGALALFPGFMFHHTGALNKDRNPYTLWKVLGDLCREDAQFKKDLLLRFTGKTDAVVFESLKEEGLEANAQKTDYMSHSDVVKVMAQSPVLLLPLNNTPNNKGVLSGKLFEYLAAQRPIFGIGLPDGDAAEILRETGAGTLFGFDDYEGMKQAVRGLYQNYKMQSLGIQPGVIATYSRKSCAASYTALLDGISHPGS
ncbi:MAG: glycosyltransferase, partial [Bacteroidia bacterium]|nr:glycosyltransferase [Bacteroidia bacterium]